MIHRIIEENNHGMFGCQLPEMILLTRLLPDTFVKIHETLITHIIGQIETCWQKACQTEAVFLIHFKTLLTQILVWLSWIIP